MKKLLIILSLGALLFSCDSSSEENEYEPIDPEYSNPNSPVDPGYGNPNSPDESN